MSRPDVNSLCKLQSPPPVVKIAADSLLLAAQTLRPSLQDLFLQTSKLPGSINYWCACCCLWALFSVLKLNNYKAFRPEGCSPIVPCFKYIVSLHFCSEPTNGFSALFKHNYPKRWLSKRLSHFSLPCSFSSSHTGLHALPSLLKTDSTSIFAFAVAFAGSGHLRYTAKPWLGLSPLLGLNINIAFSVRPFLSAMLLNIVTILHYVI